MKITKARLRQIIKEELESVLIKEYGYDPYDERYFTDNRSEEEKAAATERYRQSQRDKAAKAKLDAGCKEVRAEVDQLNSEYSGGGGQQQTMGQFDQRLADKMDEIILANPKCFAGAVLAAAQKRSQ
jgi:hypothetical protein